MVLDAFPKSYREEMDANGSISRTHNLSSRPGRIFFLGPASTLQNLLDSTHSKLPIFTILYNKYSDVIVRPGKAQSDSVQQDGLCCS